jgi:hypothetical protein
MVLQLLPAHAYRLVTRLTMTSTTFIDHGNNGCAPLNPRGMRNAEVETLNSHPAGIQDSWQLTSQCRTTSTRCTCQYVGKVADVTAHTTHPLWQC